MFKFVVLAALVAIASAGAIVPSLYNAGVVAPVASVAAPISATYTAGLGGVSPTFAAVRSGIAAPIAAAPLAAASIAAAPVVSAYSAPLGAVSYPYAY